MWFRGQLTMLIEADSSDEAVKTLQYAAESTDELIGSNATGDPAVYRVRPLPESLEVYDGPLPWDEDDEEVDC